MSDFLTWLAQSGDRITVTGILLIIIFVVIYGVQKRQRWWVPGWMLTDCEEKVSKLEERVAAINKRNQEKLDELEESLQRPVRPRRRRDDL